MDVPLSPAGILFLGLAIPVVVRLFILLMRQDENRWHRPHPSPDEGGRSFGDTSHWGGHGRPGG